MLRGDIRFVHIHWVIAVKNLFKRLKGDEFRMFSLDQKFFESSCLFRFCNRFFGELDAFCFKPPDKSVAEFITSSVILSAIINLKSK